MLRNSHAHESNSHVFQLRLTIDWNSYMSLFAGEWIYACESENQDRRESEKNKKKKEIKSEDLDYGRPPKWLRIMQINGRPLAATDTRALEGEKSRKDQPSVGWFVRRCYRSRRGSEMGPRSCRESCRIFPLIWYDWLWWKLLCRSPDSNIAHQVSLSWAFLWLFEFINDRQERSMKIPHFHFRRFSLLDSHEWTNGTQFEYFAPPNSGKPTWQIHSTNNLTLVLSLADRLEAGASAAIRYS